MDHCKIQSTRARLLNWASALCAEGQALTVAEACATSLFALLLAFCLGRCQLLSRGAARWPRRHDFFPWSVEEELGNLAVAFRDSCQCSIYLRAGGYRATLARNTYWSAHHRKLLPAGTANPTITYSCPATETCLLLALLVAHLSA